MGHRGNGALWHYGPPPTTMAGLRTLKQRRTSPACELEECRVGNFTCFYFLVHTPSHSHHFLKQNHSAMHIS